MSFWKKKKEPSPVPTPKHWRIKRKCLQLILEASKDIYPNEFGGLLRVDKEDKELIREIILLPGTVSGDAHAIFYLHMLPIDFSIIGTVHSHPSGYPIPSDADHQLFEKYGKIHIIVGYPYTETSWRAYTYAGEPIEITIV